MQNSKIAIVDYGLGNVNSVKNILFKARVFSAVISNPNDLKLYSVVILPGIGSFDMAVLKLKKTGFWDAIIDFKNSGNIILGICLGMQLLMENSEEGKSKGFGFIKGEVKKFSFYNKELRVPHMGWNMIKSSNNLFSSFENNKFYFVHSYYVKTKFEENVLSSSFYGFDFASSIINKNVIGVQFHPEKSHNYGLEFFKNFIEKYVI